MLVPDDSPSTVLSRPRSPQAQVRRTTPFLLARCLQFPKEPQTPKERLRPIAMNLSWIIAVGGVVILAVALYRKRRRQREQQEFQNAIRERIKKQFPRP